MGMGSMHHGVKNNESSELWETKDRISISMVLKDEPGVLNKALQILT